MNAVHREAEEKIQHPGEKQQMDRHPGEDLKRFAPVVERTNSVGRGETMDRGAEDEKKKGHPAHPNGDGNEVEPEICALQNR